MADYDPVTWDVINQVYDDGATGGIYEPTYRKQYRDDTTFLQETQIINSPVMIFIDILKKKV